MLAGLILLGALAALSMLPPYLGPSLGLELDVPSNVEVVDHVVAGGTVVLASLAAAWALQSGRITADSPWIMAAVGLGVLGAVWETATHVPLVLEGGEPQSPWSTVLFHSVPAGLVMVVALSLLWRLLAEPPEEEGRSAP